MKRFLALALLFVSSVALQAQSTIVTATTIVGGDKVALGKGTITMLPTDLNGNPLNVNIGITGGLVLPKPAICLISAGAITTALKGGSCTVVDTSVTNPPHFCYRGTIKDTVTGWTAPVMPCIQPSGSTWSLDTYIPVSSSTALMVTTTDAAARSLALAAQATANAAASNASAALSGSANDTTARSAAAAAQTTANAAAPLQPMNISAPTNPCATRGIEYAQITADALVEWVCAGTGPYYWVQESVVKNGLDYTLPAYGLNGTQTVGPSNIKTDASGNDLIVPGTITQGGAATCTAATGCGVAPSYTAPGAPSVTGYLCGNAEGGTATLNSGQTYRDSTTGDLYLCQLIPATPPAIGFSYSFGVVPNQPALNSAVVHANGDETIHGTKTFDQVNASAVAAGASTPTIIGSTGVTFPDGTVQSTKATGGGTWGSIIGTLASQTDLNAALAAKAASNATLSINSVTCPLSGSCTVTPLALAPMGTWASGTAYTPGQMVYYATNGNNYACVTGCASGVTPTTTANWMLLNLQSGFSAAQQEQGFSDLRTGVDLVATQTWTAGILEATGSITTGFGSVYSGFIPVTPKATVLQLTIINNYDTTRPNVLGYNAAQQPVATLLANGSVNATASSPAIITIPDGVVYVRICGGGTTPPALAKKLSIENIVTTNLSPNWSTTTGNFLAPGLAQFTTSNTVAIIGGNGTGYVPVQVGDTLRYNGYALGSLAGVGFFDSSHTYLRTWVGSNVTRGVVYQYTLNPVTDANVAYAVASDFSPDGTGFFTVQRSKNPITLLNDRSLRSPLNPLYNQGPAVDTVGGSTTEITSGVQYHRYTTTASPGYISIAPASPQEFSGHNFPVVAVQIQLVSVTSGTTAVVQWYLPGGSNGVNSASLTMTVGTTATLWAAYSSSLEQIQVYGVGTVVNIIQSTGFWLDSDYAASLGTVGLTNLASDLLLFKTDYALANYAQNSTAASTLNTTLKGGMIVTFGDSVMASFGVPTIVANAMQMSLTQLAVSGSTPYATSNLSDAQLALIPSTATLVIITGGANRSTDTPSGVIASRDRTTMEGTINYAMDWIYTNRPTCRILLATPPTISGVSLTWSSVFRSLAAYRKVPLADMDANADINASNYTVTQLDGVHPSPEGVRRMAGVLIGALRSIVY